MPELLIALLSPPKQAELSGSQPVLVCALTGNNKDKSADCYSVTREPFIPPLRPSRAARRGPATNPLAEYSVSPPEARCDQSCEIRCQIRQPRICQPIQPPLRFPPRCFPKEIPCPSPPHHDCRPPGRPTAKETGPTVSRFRPTSTERVQDEDGASRMPCHATASDLLQPSGCHS